MEDVDSPPYPSEGAAATRLYSSLGELHEWAGARREEINEAARTELIPELNALPPLKIYLGLSVVIQYAHMLFMRRTREQWDHLIRTYEDAWDCRACLNLRAVLIQTAVATLNSAFIPYEQRELHLQKENERMAKMYEQITKNLDRLVEEPEDEST